MPLRLLFLCTHNSARSIVAEGLANHLGDDRLRALSAGSHPSGRVHPLALEVLRERGCATDGLHSKSWDVYAGAEPMDALITVCDTTAGEICPLWPGAPARVHWDLSDPSGVGGDDRERLVAFRHTAGYLAARLQRVLSLPLDDFDIATLESELQCIHDTAARGE